MRPQDKRYTSDETRHEQALAFRLLVAYRWISLLPVLLWSLQQTNRSPGGWLPLLAASGLTLLITAAAAPVNRMLLQRPWLLGLDLAVAAILVIVTGLEDSPFYLYSLSPLLAAAFFFQIRGGLAAAATYALLYLIGVVYREGPRADSLDLPLVLGQVISFFLIGLIFGYPSRLLQRLQSANERLSTSGEEMARRNRDLHLVDELTLVMQSSVDLVELEETILRGLVHEMGYRRAAVGLYDEGRHALTSWLTLENLPAPAGPQRVGHTEVLSLPEDDSPLSRALRSRQPVEVLDGQALTGTKPLNKRLVVGRHYMVLPMALRENPLGIILVDLLPVDQPLLQADRASLERLAAHAGVTLGSVRLCINRVQREAIMQERTRIAADLHDSISQVLYGLAYGLDACVQLLPQHPDRVREELRRLQPVVADAQAQMRSAIFDMRADEIASDTFTARLHRHLHAICPSSSHALRIELPGEFDRWNSELRSHLYRIAQEAMTNAARHANAHRIVVTVAPNHETIEVRVEDDGKGFDPAHIDTASKFGLQSMAERVESLGGTLSIHSDERVGTSVVARVPTGD